MPYVIEETTGAAVAAGAYDPATDGPKFYEASKKLWLVWRVAKDGGPDDSMDGAIFESPDVAKLHVAFLERLDAEYGDDGDAA